MRACGGGGGRGAASARPPSAHVPWGAGGHRTLCLRSACVCARQVMSVLLGAGTVVRQVVVGTNAVTGLPTHLSISFRGPSGAFPGGITTGLFTVRGGLRLWGGCLCSRECTWSARGSGDITTGLFTVRGGLRLETALRPLDGVRDASEPPPHATHTSPLNLLANLLAGPVGGSSRTNCPLRCMPALALAGAVRHHPAQYGADVDDGRGQRRAGGRHRRGGRGHGPAAGLQPRLWAAGLVACRAALHAPLV